MLRVLATKVDMENEDQMVWKTPNTLLQHSFSAITHFFPRQHLRTPTCLRVFFSSLGLLSTARVNHGKLKLLLKPSQLRYRSTFILGRSDRPLFNAVHT